ncbi:MAG TPA: hypothetical protein VEK07_16075 [Polyangiaceae bacterium]|nr:hypothetical protein [Polyangiaceae bacterium]
MAESVTRHLRGLPPSWEQAIAESSIDALRKRTYALAGWLERLGRGREAEELRRRVAVLERADELHRHASDIETIAGLYRALATFSGEHEPVRGQQRTWAQAGALEAPTSAMHGPAFRETASLRNRAYRWLAAAVAQHGSARTAR